MRMKKFMAAILLCFAVAGCANLKFQWSASYATDNLTEDLRQAQVNLVTPPQKQEPAK